MCDHSKRPKLFCILDTCTANQCFACSQCLKRLHNNCGQENLIQQKDICAILSRYELPHQIKQIRKSCNIKLYNLLTRIKSEISNKLEEIFSQMMSKIKYPFLFHNQFLEIYRNIRDKNYQRLKKQKLNQFYRFSERLNEPQFLLKEQQYYNCYLFQNETSLATLTEKISALEQLFQFKMSKDISTLREDCLKQIKNYKETNKGNNTKDSKDSTSKIVQKIKEMYPHIDTKNRLQFRTPKKQSERLDISIDQMTLKTPSKEHLKMSQKSNDQLKNSRNSLVRGNSQILSPNSITGKSNSFEENVQIVNTKRLNLFQTSKSFNQSCSNSFINKQQSLTGLVDQSKIFKNQTGQETFCNSYDYNEQNQKTFHIKISSIKKDSLNDRLQQEENVNLSKSAQIKPQKSQINIRSTEREKKRQNFQDKIMSVIKEREENVKKRLDDLKKQRENAENQRSSLVPQRSTSVMIEQKKNVNGQLSKKDLTKKSHIQLSINEIKQSKSIVRQVNSALTYFQKNEEGKQSKILKNQNEQKPQIEKKEQKQKSPKKISQEVQLKGKLQSYESSNSKFLTKKNSVQRIDNVSLSKHLVIKQKFVKQTPNVVNTKQIPFIQTNRSQSPKKTKLQKKQSLNVSSEEEFQAACLFFIKVNSSKDKDKIKDFLEKYTQKYENNMTAIQYLTYNYLQEGKPKECLTICNKYLQKLQGLPLNQEHKLNLVINKSAALNMLSRQTQTIPFLHHKLQIIEHEKLYKNLGDAYYNKGIIDKAIYNYQKATKLNNKYDEAFYNLAVMLYIQKSYFNAKMNIDKAIAHSNKNQQYQQLLCAIQQRIKMNS